MRPAALAGALMFLLLAVPVAPLFAQQDSPLTRTKSMAEAQHEIVMLLMKKKEFEKAAAEANKIFEMKWPEGQEPLLLKEMLLLSEQFRQQGKADLSLQLIDRHSKCFKTTESRIALLKERGYLYKNMNQDEKAMDSFRKAMELEGKK
jgi:hypothetical protein